MINPTRGSVFLGAIALVVTLSLYFQPTVEAAALANNSQTEVSNQDKPTFQQSQTPTATDNSDTKTAKLLEGSSFRATAYCLKGRTASGGNVRKGIVAADPRVFPLGSRIQISAGAYSGTYTVADTGGAIRGRKLDIWVPNCSEAIRFGRKNIMVSKLSKKS